MFETNRQQAGDGSTQVQANAIIINNGVDEKRVREIVVESTSRIMDQCSQEARQIAEKRCRNFLEEFLNRAADRPYVYAAARDPGCQFALCKALVTAASTDDSMGYELLSELLIRRFERNDEPRIKAGFNRAIEVLDQVGDQELTGITVYALVETIVPTSGDITKGLEALSRVFSSVMAESLPDGSDWIYNLDILDACRAVDLFERNEIKDVFFGRLDGYTINGIQCGSDSWSQAEDLCETVGIPIHGLMVSHQLNPSFMRIPIAQESGITGLCLRMSDGERIPFNQVQIDAARKVFAMCKEGDAEIVKNTFADKWNEYPSLVRLEEWWRSDKTALRITPCGRALAFANARRLCSEFPALDNLF